MNSIVRSCGLIVFGALWGMVLAALPAGFAFDDLFTVSPFLVSAFVCSILAGRWFSGRSGKVRAGVLAALFAGVSHGVVFAVLASVSIWLCLAVNISGFSTATPGDIFNLVENPGIFAMSGIAARADGGWSVAGYNVESGKGNI